MCARDYEALRDVYQQWRRTNTSREHAARGSPARLSLTPPWMLASLCYQDLNTGIYNPTTTISACTSTRLQTFSPAGDTPFQAEPWELGDQGRQINITEDFKVSRETPTSKRTRSHHFRSERNQQRDWFSETQREGGCDMIESNKQQKTNYTYTKR